MNLTIAVHKARGPDGWCFVWNAPPSPRLCVASSPNTSALTRLIASTMWHDSYSTAHECVDQKSQLRTFVAFDDVPKPPVFMGIKNPETTSLSKEEREAFLEDLYNHLADLDPRVP